MINDIPFYVAMAIFGLMLILFAIEPLIIREKESKLVNMDQIVPLTDILSLVIKMTNGGYVKLVGPNMEEYVLVEADILEVQITHQERDKYYTCSILTAPEEAPPLSPIYFSPPDEDIKKAIKRVEIL